MRRFRILVLCGGGCCGVLGTHFLSMLPEEQQNLNKIDVLSGCSIGGILASAYAVGKKFSIIDDVFQKRAKECFTKRFNAKINLLACPTYRSDTIDNVLSDMMGDETVGDIKKHYPNLTYIVPAIDLTDDRYVVVENITGKYDKIKLKEVSGWTSAAPTYYAARNVNGHAYIDAGIVDVCSLLTATTEIKKKFGIPFNQMQILMIGTGRDTDNGKLTEKYYNDLSLIGIAKEVVIPYVTRGNELFTRHLGMNMGYNYFEYFNPCTTGVALDDVSEIPSLVKQADQHREEFLRVWNYWMSL